VVGISSDSIDKHVDFRTKHKLPFPLLSDAGGALRKLWGVPKSLLGMLPGRTTYILDQDAKVRKIFNSQTKFQQHVKESLDEIAKVKGGEKE
jgi:thioredoxin-dependent peroxiredoxin